MKTLLIILSLTLSMGAMAASTAMGPMGRIDPIYSVISTGQILVATTMMPTTSSQLTSGDLKTISEGIEKDAQDYFQSGIVSANLGQYVDNVLEQDQEATFDEALTVVLDFAAIHTGH